MKKSSTNAILVSGARGHNLKNIDVEIPHHALTVITGLSGSGKSTLAFDTLYAEGQRRYVETFSPYTRQFLERMDKPVVDRIEHIPPAIAIEQANAVKTTRSTVGTMTEIADYLKLLFARRAQLFCPKCGREIRPYAAHEIAELFLARWAGEEVYLLFAVPFPIGTTAEQAFAFVHAQGYLRALVDGVVHRLDEVPTFTTPVTELLVVQDRLKLATENRARLTEAIEAALSVGRGVVRARLVSSGEELRYSNRWYCPDDDLEFAPPTPAQFSFNSPIGACPTCRGFGRTIAIDYQRAIPDPSLSLAQGAIKPFQSGQSQECQSDLLKACRTQKVPTDKPFAQLTAAQKKFVIEGEKTGEKSGQEIWASGGWYGVRGYFDWLESKSYKMHVRVLLSRYRDYQTCSTCHGQRFQAASLAFTLGSRALTIAQINALALSECRDFFQTLPIPTSDEASTRLRTEIVLRLGYLVEVGLGYLTLDRATRTLSGGEVQRVNLTSCLGNALVHTLFVLDEPTIGLHPRDTRQLLSIIERLRDRGNTVVIVEHEEAIMRAADHVIDLGPGRGEQGGQLTHHGTFAALLENKQSLTGAYLRGERTIPLPARRRVIDPSRQLELRGAKIHNLQQLNVDLPLERFVVVSGVSGSGKSTLVHNVLTVELERRLRDPLASFTTLDALNGWEQVREIVRVDQSPLTKTPRSNAVLYLGIYDSVRELFASTESAQAQGFTASTFSFNGGTGRCPRCSGTGYEKVEMQFLADIFLTCPVCEGKRFQPVVLSTQYRGRNIDQVLQMTVQEGIAFFDPTRSELSDYERGRCTKIQAGLKLLEQVGLTYLRLGQPLNQLSGGEAQRVKLISYLAGVKPRLEEDSEENAKFEMGNAKFSRSGTRLFILDEPTTGLHFEDIRVLLELFHRMVEAGDSLVVIEHNVDVIKNADWVIELGPEGGAAGGRLVVAGTPEQVAAESGSATGVFLRPKLTAECGMRIAESPLRTPHSEIRNQIVVQNACHHNLRGISTTIDLGKITVITGLSGSGKSTLAFDLLFAEGQRRYLDSLNAYARQFVEQMERPVVDSITGLPPSVAIEQRVTRGGRKSTVSTVTEIHQFLRLLYAKLGVPHDPETGEAAVRQSPSVIVKRMEAQLEKSRELSVLAPLIKARKGLHTEIAAWAVRKKYPALRVDGKWVEPAKFKALSRFQEHTIDLVLGNLTREMTKAARVTLIETALQLGRDTLYTIDNRSKETIYSTSLTCTQSGRSFAELDPRLFSFHSAHGWCPRCQGYGAVVEVRMKTETAVEQEQEVDQAHEGLEEGESTICPECHGARLQPEARSVRLPLGKWPEPNGPSLPELGEMTIREATRYFATIKLKGRAGEIARDILPEITQRLAFLTEVGLDYLTLNRSAYTLSGGEAQRIRLSAQLGSNLQGVLYVLDEPTIGLHPRDNARLLDSLDLLKAKGNTLVVVEHDEETMRRADRIIDLGPGAGRLGGQIIADGSWQEITRNTQSVTGQLLGQPLRHPLRGSRRPCDAKTGWLEVKGASLHNLQKINVRIPHARLTVLCGVSGAGKSTLLHEVLRPAVQAKIEGKKGRPLGCTSVSGAEMFAAVVEIDQAPIGKTSRSTPATYLGVMDDLRELFAQIPLARQRGYKANRFSFNSTGGRCEACQGQGRIKVEMQFLPTTTVPCEVCDGARFNRETLEILYGGKSIAEVLGLSISEAVEFFAGVPRLQRVLQLLEKTGLGYLTLGQPSQTLSGGESQRLKLVTELARSLEVTLQKRFKTRDFLAPKNLYLLEEPTIGLHLADVKRLLELLHELVEAGHTVVVIEHHLNVIAEADHVIELGPEAGAAGGQIVAEGTPEAVARQKNSRTAPYLRPVLS